METSRRQLAWLPVLIGCSLTPSAMATTAKTPQPGSRRYWVSTLDRIARPVLSNLAAGTLKARMPVEQKPGTRRERFTHLEAFGRLMCGIAPWLTATGLSGAELKLQTTYRQWATASLANATDPASPDRLNFSSGDQALVDVAFLAQGILRAPEVLWAPLPQPVKDRLIEAMVASRQASNPKTSNWVMFAAMVEAFLLFAGQPTLEDRLEANIRLMLGWYVGDGTYGDGEFYHADYYNALVIQPMLVDTLAVLARHDPRFAEARDRVLVRSVRHAAIQERAIAHDGGFAPHGRSITYRYGALQTLAQMALMQALPAPITPAQVREGLGLAIYQLTEARGTFDTAGWLTIGFRGHQPSLGEPYISTGSLYLCAAAFLPLGLSPDNAFWAAPAQAWTAKQIWEGRDVPADTALKDARHIDVPTLSR